MSSLILGALTQALIPVGGAIITTLVSWGLLEAKNYIKSKTQNETVNDAVGHVCHTVETVVADLEQTVAAGYKNMNTDGKLTKDQATALKNIAMDRVKNQIPQAIADTAALAVNSLEELISSKIEKAVLEMKS